MSRRWRFLNPVSDLFVYGRVVLTMERKSVMPMDEPFWDEDTYYVWYLNYIKVSILNSTRDSDFFLGLPLFFLRLAKRELWQ